MTQCCGKSEHVYSAWLAVERQRAQNGHCIRMSGQSASSRAMHGQSNYFEVLQKYHICPRLQAALASPASRAHRGKADQQRCSG